MSTTIYVDSRKKGCWRRLLFRIRHRGDHPPANRGQALDLQDARRRRLPLHGPGPVSLLGRRRVGDFELGSFASRSLHGDTAGCLDQQQLRDGHLVESTNEIGVAYDGNRRILNDYEVRSLFPGTGSYPAGATPSRPLSINHLLGPSFIDGALQIFTFVTMNPYSELFLRCSTLANAADIKGPLGQDILCKCIINAGLGFVMSTRTDEGHFVKLHGPITLRSLRFKLTDVDGNTVNTRGTSVSFCVFLDYEN